MTWPKNVWLVWLWHLTLLQRSCSAKMKSISTEFTCFHSSSTISIDACRSTIEPNKSSQNLSFFSCRPSPFIRTHVNNLSFIIKMSFHAGISFSFCRFVLPFDVQVSNIIYISLYFAKEAICTVRDTCVFWVRAKTWFVFIRQSPYHTVSVQRDSYVIASFWTRIDISINTRNRKYVADLNASCLVILFFFAWRFVRVILPTDVLLSNVWNHY